MTPYDFALIAQEAYTAVPDIGIAASASRAIVRDKPAGLVVAFPGTDNLACFNTDADILITNVPGIGEVHRGFWVDGWMPIASAVGLAIADRAPIFTGHSLGAAIAILGAVARLLAGKPVAAVYGFEPPHVSPSDNIARFLKSKGVPVYLTKKGNDLVTEVPLMWHHAGPLTQIGRALHPFANIEDHAIAGVIEALTPPPVIAASSPAISSAPPAAA